ncbi:hypothetical protein SAMN04488168_101150 [Bacillus sp. 491mf]|uniref:hypothetical protein n=1 Tax=Bacillus TaxID=1386 RepID=UPI0005519DB0|nr:MULTISPECIES: hypothetical protein [unclassified Bacillus (in: firmicutes)]SFB92223.1 hypothetical protein SAMN04488168_101150 [Bacillus sp. 491mf]
MYPQYQPFPFRSVPVGPIGNSRFIPFFGFPFLAGLAGGLLGGALAFGPRPYYPPPFYPCYGPPCPTPFYY